MFDRPHHRRIARVLEALDGERLRELQCWFGGGTAIALLHGEYRESVDIDFLTSNLDGYRELRQLLRDGSTRFALVRQGAPSVALERPIRTDQYGIRTMLLVDDVPIKFEIVLEGRIQLAVPGTSDALCGVPTLTALDLAASKLLANADRWRDDSVFGRDALDLAMMDMPPRRLRPAIEKAAGAYGDSITKSMRLAVDGFRARPGWLLRCTRALSITVPAGVVQQKLRALDRRLRSI